MKTHEFHRTDTGLARVVECTCGLEISGWSWKWIDEQIKKHLKSVMDQTGDKMIGIGGAPLRATTFPEEARERKKRPVASGVTDYFPDALVAIAEISFAGNEQHNPGKPLFWDRSKSGDEADALIRHFLQRGMLDTDGKRHSAKLAWRALALLQKEIESESNQPTDTKRD